MILNLQRFLENERPYWDELAGRLDQLNVRAGAPLDLDGARRLHYLYRRAASGLAQLDSAPPQPEVRAYLEDLVSRAYAEIHQPREVPNRIQPLRWFTRGFPAAFRRHRTAFRVVCAALVAGALFGGLVAGVAPETKGVIMPFPHLLGDPSERVAREETRDADELGGMHATFASQLMVNNIRVSIFALALGITFGIGPLIVVFYNSVILGAVTVDYALAGETVFLLAWLLPHGSIEIPAFMIAGQAGLVLGNALIAREGGAPLRRRLRRIGPDLVFLVYGVAIILVWAGIVESFFSQYHEPVVPYWAKIAFGAAQLAVFFWFMFRFGRTDGDQERKAGSPAP